MRCFYFKPIPRLRLRKTKIPLRGFFKTFYRKRTLRLPKFRIGIITRKKIIAAVSVVSLGTFLIVASKTYNNKIAVPAFSTYNPDEIVSDILPGEKEPGIVNKIKKRISSLRKTEPGEIVKEYGGVLGRLSSPVPKPIETQSPPPEKVTPKSKTLTAEALLKNETDYTISEDDFKNLPLGFSKQPTVLIIHTHTTECYTPTDATNLPDNGRSTDEMHNMIAIGKVMEAELSNKGIKVIHDPTVHDYPSYQGAYGRSLSTAQQHLAKNDSIELILDIHRDAVTDENGNRIKLVKNINGTECAQLMTVCGTDSGGLSHPDWCKNLNFAIKLQKLMNSSYPGIMRPINLRKERFNQHLTPGSLIIEVGTHGNSLAEAKNSALLIAEKIGELLTQ